MSESEQTQPQQPARPSYDLIPSPPMTELTKSGDKKKPR
jgi:hypothetical protein